MSCSYRANDPLIHPVAQTFLRVGARTFHSIAHVLVALSASCDAADRLDARANCGTIQYVTCPVISRASSLCVKCNNTSVPLLLSTRVTPFQNATRLLRTQQNRHSVAACSAEKPVCQFPKTRVVSRGRRNTGLQSIRRSSKSQGLSWPGIESQSDLVQLRLREPGQVGVLWQVLPQ